MTPEFLHAAVELNDNAILFISGDFGTAATTAE